MSSSKKEASIEVVKERSLRTTPPVYAPSFIIYHGKNYRYQTFCIPSDQSHHVRSIPEMRGMMCTASFYGWLYLESRSSNECLLFDPVTLTKIQLPTLIDDTFECGVLTSPPTEQNCLAMFVSDERHMCVFCRIGDTNWTTQKLKCRSNDGMVITDIIEVLSTNGKIYVFFYGGIAVIDVQDGFACIETHEMRHIQSKIPSNTYVRYLESSGEIFQVRTIKLSLSQVVQKFVVLKLDLSTMVLRKVESIGGRIFLLGTCSKSLSLSAAEFGGKGNCIYFFAHGKTNMYCYDMEDGTIMVTQPCPTKFPQWEISAWVVPNRKMQAKKQVADVTEEALVNNSIFPAEIMEKIFQSLHSGGNIRFRLATKSFISMIPPVRSFNPQILSSTQDLPWLVSFPNSTEKICYFYHPIYTDVYTTNFSRLRDSIIRHAKFGWLLMSVGRSCFFFFNPLTGETVQLPTGYPPYGTFINISFSSPPTSTDCVVFGHMSCGKLGVFNPNESNEEDMWKVYTNLSVPSVRLSTTKLIYQDSTRSFIVERDSEILCVFVGCIGDPVHVYKLDQSKETKKWIRVESLGDRVMFLSHTTSILVPAVLKGTENRIYLPRFKKNASVFYSLKSGKYHSFGDQDSRADWINTSEHWNCTWFQIPSATHPS